MDANYIVQLTPDGKLSVYTKTKKFFREKMQQVSLLEFFNTSKRDLLMKGRYSIFPNAVGIGTNTYLSAKAQYNLLNGQSDFNQRTVWKISNFADEHEKVKVTDDISIYSGTITGDLNVSDASGNTIFSQENFSLPYADSHIPSEKEAELLLQNAANGTYTTARDRFAYLDEVHKNCGLGGAKLICEECGEIFDSLPEFFSHLIETGHKDSILSMHKDDPEIKKLIGLINKGKEEEA